MYNLNALSHGGAYAEAEARRYRAECLVRCLEASLDRTDPENFNEVMDRLETAQTDLLRAARDVMEQRWLMSVEMYENR